MPALSTCFTANGAIGNPTPSAVTALGRDVVYRFTAPSNGNYSFHLSNIDPLGGANLILHLSSDCPTAEATATPTTAPLPTNTPAVVPACVAAANRTTTTTFGAEEVPCLAMTAGQTVFVFVDEATYLASQLGGNFYLEATRCVSEVEPKDVYKRQALHRGALRGDPREVRVGRGSGAAVRALPHADAAGSVSYTHLDVYKRQALTS